MKTDGSGSRKDIQTQEGLASLLECAQRAGDLFALVCSAGGLNGMNSHRCKSKREGGFILLIFLSASTLAHKGMPTPARKRRLCSYDMAEVPPECYWLDDAQGAVYFCNARCLCIWSTLLATKANLPEQQKVLDLYLMSPGGARSHFNTVRELARWAFENALGRANVAES